MISRCCKLGRVSNGLGLKSLPPMLLPAPTRFSEPTRFSLFRGPIPPSCRLSCGALNAADGNAAPDAPVGRTAMSTLHPIFGVAFMSAVLIASTGLPAQAHKHHRHGGNEGWGGPRNEWVEQRWREHEAREWAWRHQPDWAYWPYYNHPYSFYRPNGYGFSYRYGYPQWGWPGW
jgi:hypothetical protein